MRSLVVIGTAAGLLLLSATPASALPRDVTRTTFRYPVELRPGANKMRFRTGVPKPAGPGYVVRFRGDLTYRDGSIPSTDTIHLHHAVWFQSHPGSGLDIIAENGEEKTVFKWPRPYGLRVEPSDTWIVDEMIHDLTPHGARLYLTYTVDFVRADSSLGRTLHRVTPLWMDVLAGNLYPVFDVPMGGGAKGRFTFPGQAPGVYAGGWRRNQVSLTRAGTLVGFAGHMHPGALHNDLRLRRGGRSRLVFRSEARYFGGRPPVSWDFAATVTRPSWRVRVQPGDTLAVSSTYDSRLASWHESMGIMLGWIAYDDDTGADPFTSPIQTRGQVTHGHLPENDRWGGARTSLPDPRRLPDGAAPGGVVPIGGFKYVYGDLRANGAARNPPTVREGSSLTFVNRDARRDGLFHTVTACRPPCNRSTGIGFPLANGVAGFDSGQLGFGPQGFTAAANRDSWKTPANLEPGTYTYLCRGHPFMRGAFRVVPVT